MAGTCQRHYFERSFDVCGGCGEEFCEDCLVYPFATIKPPYCLQCAVRASGVRGGGQSPRLGRAQRRQVEQRRAELQDRRGT